MRFSFVQPLYQIKPLHRLLKNISRLKRGDYNIMPHPESRDEIGQINLAFYQMSRELNEKIKTVYLSKIKQREAELAALESQINPHFLYNTLDSIRWLALKHRDYDVVEQIEALSGMFKHVLNKGQSLVTIQQEIDFIKNYMFIQEMKYGDRIRLIISADGTWDALKCPKLILQPLVENALVHGLDHVEKDGVIEVKVEKEDWGVKITVADNRAGTDEERVRGILQGNGEGRHGFALKNINDRIKMLFGEAYGLYFTSRISEGTCVEVRLPLVH